MTSGFRDHSKAGRPAVFVGFTLALALLGVGFARPPQPAVQARIAPGSETRFTATAYCDRGITKAGVRTRQGIIAADPAYLPVGSVVRIEDAGSRRYEGIYTVMDIGGLVQGHRVDLYIPSCDEAREFGLREVTVEVLRLGWHHRSIARRDLTAER